MSENLSVTATEAHQCTCGHHDEEVPELDVRLIPHAIRHAAVFGALSSIAAGKRSTTRYRQGFRRVVERAS